MKKANFADIKKVDKLYSFLVKNNSEAFSCEIIQSMNKMGLIPFICLNLKVGSLHTARVILEACKNVKIFADMIRESMHVILMASLSSEEAMKIALLAEDEYIENKVHCKLTNEMVICIYRHSFLFPSNREACAKCVRKYIKQEEAILKPILFFKDEDEILYKFFDRDTDIRKHILQFCTEADATKTYLKALHYYKLPIHNIVNLSFTEFIHNIKLLDLNNILIQVKILEEICNYNRWDFLPYIFENIKLDFHWKVFRYSLVRGHTSVAFVQTLLHLMKKYNYSYNLLAEMDSTFIICSEKVKQLLLDHGLGEMFKVKGITIFTDNIKGNISNLFDLYRNADYEDVITYLFLSFGNSNNRFLKERLFANTLVESDSLGWTREIKTSWIAFCAFTDEIIEELNYLNLIIVDYNSYYAVSTFTNNMLGIRCLNQAYKNIHRIKIKSILAECVTLYGYCEKLKWDILKGVRDEIGIDLDVEEDWVLPENPTLEDLFMELYQYSCLSDKARETEIIEYNNLEKLLKENKFFKICEEVEQCMLAFIPIDDVKTILIRKKII